MLEILRPTIGGRGECAVQPLHVDVLLAHVVMIRHDEMRKHGLGCSLPPRIECGHLADDAIRTKGGKQVELPLSRGFRPMVGEIDDLALPSSLDCRMR